MSSRVVRGPAAISAGVAALAMALAGCGGSSATRDAKTVADTPAAAPATSSSPTAERALALVDDEESAEAAQAIVVDVLGNDSVTLVDGTAAELLTEYDEAELVLAVDTPPTNGTAAVDGTSIGYTSAAGYGGEDEFTYKVEVKGEAALTATAVVRITVAKPTPTPTPTKAKAKAKPKVYFTNCDAARAAGAAPVRTGDAGYARHLDRDGDGVGCEPYGGSGGSSTGGSGSGGSSSGGSTGGGGGSTYYANCTAVRAAGAAPIRTGDPGYGRHLDRDGDGVACE
ncbi:excalibur calcium-binding domain-containing protein [Streptomyces sp. NPDC051219]|uniref:excalibur calcium-binding domain-containing protein n=1 Tax=Streptomyces sp. NPDC051219 TaxID=3155283 RepID=UPI0034341665